MNQLEQSWRDLMTTMMLLSGEFVWPFPTARKRDGRLYIVGWNEEPLIMMKEMR